MERLELKVPPVVLTLLFAAVMFFAGRYLPAIQVGKWVNLLFALLTLILAAGFCVAGVVEFRRHQTTVDPRFPEKASSLVSGGVYAYSRNPMYVGFALSLIAIVCWLGSPWLILGVVVFVIYMNRFQIMPEERMLLRMFGEHYQHYMKDVRRWL